MNNSPFISIIILNWNGLNDTINCLNSLKKITYPNYEIIVVDNGSKNDECRKIKEKYGDYAKFICNEKNIGFTGGNNVALKQIIAENKNEYVLLLNNDTEVKENFLDIQIEYAEQNKSIGILGPKIYYWQKDDIIQSVGGKINFYTGKIINRGQLQKDSGQYNDVQDVDCVSGCALLIKTEVIKKIGLLDEKYFAYWEETDWCQKAKKRGYQIRVIPQAVIWHKEYSSSKTEFSDYQITRNKLWFMKKHASVLQYCIFNLYLWLFTVPARILKRQNIKIFFKAIKDGYYSL